MSLDKFPNPNEEQNNQVEQPEVLDTQPKITDSPSAINLSPGELKELGELAREVRGKGLDENTN